MQSIKLTVATLSVVLLASLGACRKENAPQSKTPTGEAEPLAAGRKASPGFADNDAVLYWNQKTSLVLTAPINPQSQSRYFAMVQIAVHDALNAIKPKYERYALLDTRDPFASPDAAVASAAYYAIIGMNIQRTYPVLDWYNETLSTIPDGESKERGIALGKAAAEAIIAKRASDNFAQANVIRAVPDGVEPGQYRSTLPYSLEGMPRIKGLDPWGTLLKPFVIASSTQFRVAPPYPLTSAAYAADYNEVKWKGGRAVHTRTAGEDEIGRFWVERSSIGWNRFARNLVADKKMDAWKTARLLALMHTAMADGTIANFESKYYYFYWRPETAIRLGAQDGNPATVADPTWLPGYTETPNPTNPALNVNTPPVPEYPSAHANFGGAAGEVLRLFFETDNISVDQTSSTTPGVTRHYSSLSSAIRDNSLSRIYVGYHFRNAVMKGEEQGIQVATYVFNHAFRESKD